MDLSLHQLLEFALGLLYLGLVLVIARRVGRLARAFPWLVVLIVFFALRAVERLMVVAEIPMSFMPMLLHAASVLALFLLVLGSHRLADALEASQERAEVTTREYERALDHYTQVMRHRLANPLTAIRGGVSTLQHVELDDTTRAHLLEAMEQQARELEAIALHPEREGVEEHELDAVPRVEEQLQRRR